MRGSTATVCEEGWLGASGEIRPVTCLVLCARSAAMTITINTTTTTELFNRLARIASLQPAFWSPGGTAMPPLA